MRRKLALCALAATSATLGPAVEAYATSCIPAIRYREAVYLMTGSPSAFLPIQTRRRARVPLRPCGEVIGPPQPPPRVNVHRLRGVHPSVALGERDHDLWLAVGFLPQLPSHPLHELLTGRWRSKPRPLTCSRPFALVGRVTSPPSVLRKITLTVAHVPRIVGTFRRGDVDVTIGSDTTVVGMRRLGLPFIGLGAHVRVLAVRCRAPGEEPDDPPRILARTIRATTDMWFGSLIVRHGIGGARPRMARREVTRRFGAPDLIARAGPRLRRDPVVVRHHFSERGLAVDFVSGQDRVWRVSTRDPRHRTAVGLGVRSRLAEVRGRVDDEFCRIRGSVGYCLIDHGVVTVFYVREGRVTSVAVQSVRREYVRWPAVRNESGRGGRFRYAPAGG